MAIATERGLVVPVLRNAERLSFAELEKAIGDFARRAKDGKLKPIDLEGGTFTITNGGAFGSLLSRVSIRRRREFLVCTRFKNGQSPRRDKL